MRNVLTIFKNDVKALTRHFFAFLIILAILILPALYAWFNIYAFWDPYSNTDNIRVAVVSDDMDYMDADGKIVNMGNDLIAELKESEDIGYVFLDDADAAVEGVHSGEYYAAVIVEPDFTYNMYNFLTADMDNPTISFYQNEKSNAIAIKIVEAAADDVKHSVNEKYIKAMVETLFDKLNNFSEDVQGDSSVDMLKNTLEKINGTLDVYGNSINSFINANSQLITTLNNTDNTLGYSIYLIGNEKVNISKQVDYIESTQDDLSLINAEINEMLLGIESSVDEAIYKLDRLYSGNEGDVGDAKTALDVLEGQYRELVDYLARSGMSGTDVEDALTALNDLANKIDTLRDKLGLNSENVNIYQTRVLAKYNAANIQSLETDYEDTAVPAVYTAVTGESYDNLSDPANSNASMDSMMKYMVEDSEGHLANAGAELANAVNAPNEYSKNQYLDKAYSEAEIAAQEAEAVDVAVNAIEAATGTGTGLSDSTGKAADDTRSFADWLDDIRNGDRDIDLVADLDFSNELIENVRVTLTETVYPALDTMLEGLQDSLGDISGLLGELSGILGKTQPIIGELGNTFAAVNKALAQVQDLINSYMGRLDEFIDVLNGNTDDERIQNVLDFFDIDPSAVGEFLSSPVEIENEAVYPVESYGTAMTPFYTMLAIWVGCVIINSIIKSEAPVEVLGATDTQRFFGRYLVFLLISLIQTMIIMLGDIFLLGVDCVRPGLFLLTGVFTSLTCSMLAYAFAVAFGNIGKFLIVVIMIIQIAGSGGSYPIELLPGFFRQVYLFFPFPYAINAMREAIAGLYQNAYLIYILQLLIFFAVGILIGIFAKRSLFGINRYMHEQLEKTEMM